VDARTLGPGAGRGGGFPMMRDQTAMGPVGLEAPGGEPEGPGVLGGDPDDLVWGAAGVLAAAQAAVAAGGHFEGVGEGEALFFPVQQAGPVADAEQDVGVLEAGDVDVPGGVLGEPTGDPGGSKAGTRGQYSIWVIRLSRRDRLPPPISDFTPNRENSDWYLTK
jgi:hypothetical protein